LAKTSGEFTVSNIIWSRSALVVCFGIMSGTFLTFMMIIKFT